MTESPPVIYPENQQAPYLHVEGNQQCKQDEEADAAGGLQKRVSSFSLLPRSIVVEERPRSPTPEPHEPPTTSITPDWRLLDRMKKKTVGVGLILALNIGTDPPDVTKPHPCAVLECWMDPRSVSRSKAKEMIGERLEQQYSKWQLARTARPLKYRRAIDPSVEDVRTLCLQLRRQARSERILVHYNGHGVPRPTTNGEIWVFDRNHTEYIPLSIMDLRLWMGQPSIVVLDCSSAGILLPVFQQPESDTIVLCPCSEDEWLPMTPDYPADIFTSCLTTPLPIALRWFVRHSAASMPIAPDAVDAIPGKANDRKTPLGELNWIFTAVTDSIAWNVLPKPLFQRLFRQDLLVASLFRNFLLADRILQSLGCTPISNPPLPPTADHPLWQAWDLACETLLFQLMQQGLFDQVPKTDDDAVPAPPMPEPVMVSSPFFSEQLTAFEVWLDFSHIHKMQLRYGTLQPPEQLPVVLQVLLSQTHRIRALQLLRRFLNLGPWAVNLALSLGIFPYVMKLLQSPEYKSLLVSIWASILAFDPSCRVDLLKDGHYTHFVQHLLWGLNSPADNVAQASRERTLAAFVLAAVCHEYPAGQAECIRLNLHGNCCALLSSYEQGESSRDSNVELHLPADFRIWLCMCLGNMVKENTATQNEAYNAGAHSRLAARIRDRDAQVRATVCYALGCFVGLRRQGSRSSSAQDLTSNEFQQRISAANLTAAVVPSSSLSASAGVQATFDPAGLAAMPWRPSNLEQAQAVPSTDQRQPRPIAPQFLDQPQSTAHMFSPQQPLPMQPHYVMPHAGMGGPAGFLVGSNPVVATGKPSMMIVNATPQVQQPQQPNSPSSEPRNARPSVYADKARLEVDLDVTEPLMNGTKDGSVVVRYEAVIALGHFVAKHIEAFICVAEERSRLNSPKPSDQGPSFPTPVGLNRQSMDRFRAVWETLRSLQHDDPFPAISKASNQIVSVVHEHLLRFRTENELDDVGLSGIDEETTSSGLSRTPPGNLHQSRSSGQKLKKLAGLRRAVSEVASGNRDVDSMEKNALLSSGSSHNVTPDQGDTSPFDYSLPQSEYYQWKKNTFNTNSDNDLTPDNDDPLSPIGAARAYRESRNITAQECAQVLHERFSCLAPKPPRPKMKSIEMLLEEENEEALEAAEEVATARKRELELEEERILRNEGVSMTSMIRFHSFEDVLVACGSTGSVSLFDTANGSRLTTFENGSPDGSRMTTCSWLNEEFSSLLLIGCDDGTVRIWDNFLESNGEATKQPPNLLSAYYACPMKPGKRSSGLICEWQPFSGMLLAGGNSKVINCWDVQAEHLIFQMETNSDANLTTMTTAWDFDQLGMGPIPSGYQGIGRDIVVGGFSDGTLKIFDLRMHGPASDMADSPQQRRRHRPTGYSEHKSWIVATAFTGYAHRYELISGTLAGEIKAWDLRVSSSVRTVEVQRSTMTALTVHSKIPLVASGSNAQFIKMLTLDGDTLQVIRYHEKMASHRIGPVSCLAFHKYKPALAAGATDTYIGLYRTKKRIY